ARTLEEVRMNRARRILLGPPIEEKHYALGRVSLTILKGPVKLTPWRATIILGVIGAGFAIFFLSLALASNGFTESNQQLIFVGIFLVLLVINFWEVRWRRADAPKTKP
ncbi:MAG TPA: hypothetical protein VLM38_20040, partial [Blastocatellia bacterium]|nr:hypothetical protein [Blastocatellia bacterium]